MALQQKTTGEGDAHLAQCQARDHGAGMPGLGLVEKGALVAQGGVIAFVGPEADLPARPRSGAEIIDCGGRLITPGLIDCHTHLVHAGNRASEFEMRLAGATYEEVARAGGGIVSSVHGAARRQRGRTGRQSLPRLDALMAEGVTTVEIKSGYGLDLENEAKSLRAARRLGYRLSASRHGLRRPAGSVCTTFLGAHALPPEAAGDKDAYIATRRRTTCCPPSPQHGLADAVDGFCEGIAFSPDADRDASSSGRGASACRSSCMPTSSPISAARRLPPAIGALSADHVEYHRRGRRRRHGRSRARSPCCCPAPSTSSARRKSRRSICSARHGVPMAIATDCNPGTSPLTSLLLTMNMAATLFSPDGRGMPARRHAPRRRPLWAARQQIGTLEAGKIRRPRHLGCRAPRRTRLPHGLQPAASRASGEVDEQSRARRPASVSLGDWQSSLRGRAARRSTRPATPRSRPAPRWSRGIVAKGDPVYGINTGFGKLASVRIAADDVETLQRNLILSHCCGVGEPLDAGDRAAGHGAEARLARARRFRRAAGDRDADRGDAGARHPAGHSRQGLGRRLGRSRAARPHGRRDDGRRRRDFVGGQRMPAPTALARGRADAGRARGQGRAWR